MKAVVLILILIQVLSCYSDEKENHYETKFRLFAAYYPPHHFGYGKDGGLIPIQGGHVQSLPHLENDPGQSVGKGWGSAELKGQLSFNYRAPFLQKDGPLFSNNNLNMTMLNELSPVHFETAFVMDWTFIAFLYFTAEQRIGTGWRFLSFNGLGRNLPGKEYEKPLYESFSGIVYTRSFSATFQFDLGALIKSDYSHFVISATAKFRNRIYSNADDNTAWQYLNDWGENFNGWQFLGTYFGGYLMPFSKVFNLAGIHIETEQHITHKNRSKMDSGWGSDFIMVRFGPLLNMEFSDNFSLTTIVHFIKDKKWSDETIGNRYFEHRKYAGYYIALDRIVFAAQYKF